MNNFDLIIPFAAKTAELAYLYRGAPEELPFVKGIKGLAPEKFDRIVVGILAADDQRFDLSSPLRAGFAAQGLGDKLQIVRLEQPTRSQAETIAETLKRLDRSGGFWVKDPDNYFRAEPIPGNAVTVFPLDALARVNPQNKSYLAISDGDYILNLAEKRIIGRYFCTGGYGFDDKNHFLETFDRLRGLGKLYLSHIIYRMLLDGVPFRPLYVSDYQDWGSLEDWQAANAK